MFENEDRNHRLGCLGGPTRATSDWMGGTAREVGATANWNTASCLKQVAWALPPDYGWRGYRTQGHQSSGIFQRSQKSIFLHEI